MPTKTPRLTSAALLIVLSAGACDRPAPEPTPDVVAADSPVAAAPVFDTATAPPRSAICDTIQFRISRSLSSRAAIDSILGEPDSIAALGGPDSGVPALKVKYPRGVTVIVDGGFAANVVYTETHPLLAPLRMGMTRAEVIALLGRGQPQELFVEYNCGSGRNEPMYLQFDSTRLTSVTFARYER